VISDVAPAEEGGQSEGTPAQKEGVLARVFGAPGSDTGGPPRTRAVAFKTTLSEDLKMS